MLHTYYRTLFIVGLLVLIGAGYATFQRSKQSFITPLNTQSVFPCVPTFADGDGPYYLPNAPMQSDFRAPGTRGVSLTVRGKVFRSDCVTPAANIELDLWQANENGIYVNEWNRGRIRTNADGSYTFTTVVPKGYGEGTAYRPPHIHFKVRENGNLLVTSEMFFPDVKGKEGFNDAFIMQYQEQNVLGKISAQGYHTIILP